MKKKQIAIFILLLLNIWNAPILYSGFKEQQLNYVRVRGAKDAADAQLRTHFAKQDLIYPPNKLFIRVLKSENVLEVWTQTPDQTYSLAKTYEACAMSGLLGPKQKQGDKQVPEGFYDIATFNPSSQYHLSMKVSYPNRSDRVLSPYNNLGGDIYVHGECASIGCVSITNPLIQEVYWLCTLARANGQRRIPIHIFPARLSDFKLSILQHLYEQDRKLVAFWENLQVGYQYFEEYGRPPKIQIDDKGRYLFGDD